MSEKKLLYFGHPVNVYGTSLEEGLLAEIGEAFAGWDILNPSGPEHEEGYQRYKREGKRGMQYFFQEVLPNCEGGIFLPFLDGMFGKGVAGEAEWLLERNKPVWTISVARECSITRQLLFPENRILSVEETRERIRFPDGSSRPYWS